MSCFDCLRSLLQTKVGQAGCAATVGDFISGEAANTCFIWMVQPSALLAGRNVTCKAAACYCFLFPFWSKYTSPVFSDLPQQSAALIMCLRSNAHRSCHATPQHSSLQLCLLEVLVGEGRGAVHPSNLCSAGYALSNYDYSGERNRRRQLHC